MFVEPPASSSSWIGILLSQKFVILLLQSYQEALSSRFLDHPGHCINFEHQAPLPWVRWSSLINLKRTVNRPTQSLLVTCARKERTVESHWSRAQEKNVLWSVVDQVHKKRTYYGALYSNTVDHVNKKRMYCGASLIMCTRKERSVERHWSRAKEKKTVDHVHKKSTYCGASLITCIRNETNVLWNVILQLCWSCAQEKNVLFSIILQHCRSRALETNVLWSIIFQLCW